MRAQSGGTIVPFEEHMVRFLDNFSAGTRGATTAELLLQHYPDYHVIFLHRLNSMTPLNRKYTHGKTLPLEAFFDASAGTLDKAKLQSFEKDANALHQVKYLRKGLLDDSF